MFSASTLPTFLEKHMAWQADDTFYSSEFPVLADKFYSNGAYLPPVMLADLLASSQRRYSRPFANASDDRLPPLFDDTAAWIRWLKDWRSRFLEVPQRLLGKQGIVGHALADCQRLSDYLGSKSGPLHLSREQRPGLITSMIASHTRWFAERDDSALPSDEQRVVKHLRVLLRNHPKPEQLFSGLIGCFDQSAGAFPSDLFVTKLLPTVDPEGTSLGRDAAGRELGGQQPRHTKSSHGVFWEWLTGSLPEDLGRLSCLELLYLREEPDYFLNRVGGGGLVQRFGNQTQQSKMRASALIEVYFDETEAMHRISARDTPPIISMYRAILTTLVHLLVIDTEESGIDLTLRIVHRGLLAQTDDFFDSDRLRSAAESVSATHRLLLLQAPQLFQNAPTQTTSSTSHLPPERRHFDFCHRMLLGPLTVLNLARSAHHATYCLPTRTTSARIVLGPDGASVFGPVRGTSPPQHLSTEIAKDSSIVEFARALFVDPQQLQALSSALVDTYR